MLTKIRTSPHPRITSRGLREVAVARQGWASGVDSGDSTQRQQQGATAGDRVGRSIVQLVQGRLADLPEELKSRSISHFTPTLNLLLGFEKVLND